jgi:Undecaprenyl-phosphate glucose phosphotransferase
MTCVEQTASASKLVPRGHGKTPDKTDSSLRFTSNICGTLYFTADLICFVVSIPISLLVYRYLIGSRLNVPVHAFAWFVAVGAFVLIRRSRHSYRMTLIGHDQAYGELIVEAAASTLIASAVIWQFGMITNYSRGITLLFLAALSTMLVISRPIVASCIKRLAARGAIQQRIAFYGADRSSIDLIRRVVAAVKLPHLRFVGVADDRPKVKEIEGLAFIGGCTELVQFARNGGVDQILVAVPHLRRERLHEIVDELSQVSVDVSLIPTEAIELAPDYRVFLLGSIPVLNLWQRPFRDINQLVKRGEDILFGTLILVLFLPLIALTALLIRLTSPGPVLFVQPRIGFNNELIPVFKFRTMYADQTDLHARNTTSRDDPRVTPVGRILRRLSIDELPQLFNVLRGEMSLVGPRPHALEMKVSDRFYQDAVRGYAGRHRVRPGLTGLAQVRGLRGEIRTLERAKQRVDLDKQYIDDWSLWLDLRILLATVRAVFFDDNAY